MTRNTPPHIADLVDAAIRPVPEAGRRQLMLDVASVCGELTEQPSLVKLVAGPMASIVSRVFGGLSDVFVLTCPKRRQVYLAVLARLDRDGHLAGPNGRRRAELIARLLSAKNEALIADVYSGNPIGFLSIVTALGDTGKSPDLYLDLYDLVDGAPELARALRVKLEHSPLSREMLAVLRQLPRRAESVKLASRFKDVPEFEEFLDLYRLITGLSEISRDHINEMVVSNVNPEYLLDNLLSSHCFHDPIIHGIGNVRYLRNGKEIMEVSGEKHFNTDHKIGQALRNEYQFYVVTMPDGSCFQFDLFREDPFGWSLDRVYIDDIEDAPSRVFEAVIEIAKDFGLFCLKNQTWNKLAYSEFEVIAHNEV